MSKAILLHCRRCGVETTSESSREAMCFGCLANQALADALPELRRLLQKAARYQARGAQINPEPARRWHQRAQLRLMISIPPHEVRPQLERLTSEVQESVRRDLGSDRIARALPGDLIQIP